MVAPVHMIRATGYCNILGVVMDAGDSMPLRSWIYSASGDLLEVVGALKAYTLIVSLAGVDLTVPEAISVCNGMWPEKAVPQKEMEDVYTFVVADQAEMLALRAAKQGDVAVRTDLSKSFILAVEPYSDVGNWQELLTPGDAVLSVNGYTGAVALTTTDITEDTNLYHTTARVEAIGDARYLPLDANIDHEDLLNVGVTSHADLDLHVGDATIHRSINDAGVGLTDLWSASKISSELGNYIPLTQKAAANGVATLGADAKIPNSQLPALVITDTFVVGSQAAMLALSTAEQGDVAVRTDLSKSFILTGSPPSTLGNWQELLTPGDAVLSVNGNTGAVTLTTTDVGEGTNLYHTTARVEAVGDARYLPLAANSSTWAISTPAKAYLISGSGDGPSGGVVYMGIHLPHGSGSYATQIAGRNGIYYMRSWENGSYTAWDRVVVKSYGDTLYAPISHTQAWSTITGTPTTLAGYGITDGAPTNHASTATTYGIGTSSNYGHVKFSTSAPLMDGTAWSGDYNLGIAAAYNHRHPVDTSRAPVSHTHTYQQITGMPRPTTEVGDTTNSLVLGSAQTFQPYQIYGGSQSGKPPGVAYGEAFEWGYSAKSRAAIAVEWGGGAVGAPSGNPRMFVRSMRDTADVYWSEWARVFSTLDLPEISEVTGLQDALDAKADDTDLTAKRDLVVTPTISGWDEQIKVTKLDGRMIQSRTNPRTGALVITLPWIPSTSAMTTLKIRGGNYSTTWKEAWELVLGGYAYNNSQPYWARCWSELTWGYPSFAHTDIHFGKSLSTGKAVIVLGNVGTTWQYPWVELVEIITTYSGYNNTSTNAELAWTTDLSDFSESTADFSSDLRNGTARYNSGQYVPYSGATTSVNLGSYDLTAKNVSATNDLNVNTDLDTTGTVRVYSTTSGFQDLRFEGTSAAGATRILNFGTSYGSASYQGMFTLNHGGAYRFFLSQDGLYSLTNSAATAAANTDYKLLVDGSIKSITDITTARYGYHGDYGHRWDVYDTGDSIFGLRLTSTKAASSKHVTLLPTSAAGEQLTTTIETDGQIKAATLIEGSTPLESKYAQMTSWSSITAATGCTATGASATLLSVGSVEVVHLKGNISAGSSTARTTLGTIPASCWPSTSRYVTGTYSTPGGFTPVSLLITDEGKLQYADGTARLYQVFLDGITYSL